MSYSPHKILIDLEEYNELIALNVTYKKFLHLLKRKGLHYQVEVRDGKFVLYIFSPKLVKSLGHVIEVSSINYAKDSYSNYMTEMFDIGLDYLETLK